MHMGKCWPVLVSMLFVTLSNAHLQAEEVHALRPQLIPSVKNDVSPALRDLPSTPPSAEPTIREIPLLRLPRARALKPREGPWVDSVLQDWHGSPEMPAPLQNFEGINNRNQVLPPDTNGAVGPNHYVQWVNLSIAVYSRTGTLLAGPVNGNLLWSGFGGPCETTNDGDPIALYDHLADRWLLSQLALPNFPNGPSYQCVAISQTPDPTGAYFRYAFQISATKLNDYPKFGVWPDAYYMSINQFNAGSLTWAGAGTVAFERHSMLAGLPARMVYFDLFAVNPNFGGMLPAALDGPAPPLGSPNFFVEVDDASVFPPNDALRIWQFHVDWTNPANSTFGVNGNPNTVLNTAPFDWNMCNFSPSCIPQPGPSARLDAISDRLMYRLQYRNFGTHQALVVNHTVDVDGTDHAGIRWYELRDSGSGFQTQQQGTYAPDSAHRWMGSIAMDGAGDMALGFSVSSTSTFPSIRYAGRLASDPLGTLAQGETTLIAGSGSQTHSSGRWGDYSMMAVDPTDDCTFWYTQEYYTTTSVANWQTRIGSFRFPSCPISGPRLSLWVSQSGFRTGEQLTLYGQVTPGASPTSADVYVAIQLPDGTVFFWLGDGNATSAVQPLASNVSISSPLFGQLFTFTFGGGEPVGTYTWYGAFTQPGTLNLIGAIASAPFTFTP